MVFFKWIKDCRSISTASIPILKLEMDPTIGNQLQTIFLILHFSSLLLSPFSPLFLTFQIKLKDFMDFVYPNPPINYLDFSDQYDFLNLRKTKSESIRIKMDISVENINYAGIMNEFIGGISTALVNKWQERLNAMQKIAVFMKYVFNEHGFNNSYKGKFTFFLIFFFPIPSYFCIFFQFAHFSPKFSSFSSPTFFFLLKSNRQMIFLIYYAYNLKLHFFNIGGLSSYCLVIMIVAFLIKFDLGNSVNFAELILKFLEFYGLSFDPKSTGIDVNQDNK